MATSFSGGRSWSTREEPPTMGKQMVRPLEMRENHIKYMR